MTALTRAHVALLHDVVLLRLPAGVVGGEALAEDGVALVDVLGVGGDVQMLGLDDDHKERQSEKGNV